MASALVPSLVPPLFAATLNESPFAGLPLIVALMLFDVDVMPFDGS